MCDRPPTHPHRWGSGRSGRPRPASPWSGTHCKPPRNTSSNTVNTATATGLGSSATQPESPRNIRLTHDTQLSRTLAWDPPLEPWLTTLKTARTGPGPQQSVTDPWITGYRIERAEYRTDDDGDWYLPHDGVWETLRYETDVDTATTHTDTTDQGDTRYVYRVWAHNAAGPNHYSFDDDWAFNGPNPEPTE